MVNNTKRHGLNSFKYYTANQWNMLPDKVCVNAGTKKFIRLIQNFDFKTVVILRKKNTLLLHMLNNTKRYGLNSFKYYTANQWNVLPDKVCDKAGTKKFIRLIQDFDFKTVVILNDFNYIVIYISL